MGSVQRRTYRSKEIRKSWDLLGPPFTGSDPGTYLGHHSPDLTASVTGKGAPSSAACRRQPRVERLGITAKGPLRDGSMTACPPSGECRRPSRRIALAATSLVWPVEKWEWDLGFSRRRTRWGFDLPRNTRSRRSPMDNSLLFGLD
jgi:hypothetical protein